MPYFILHRVVLVISEACQSLLSPLLLLLLMYIRLSILEYYRAWTSNQLLASAFEAGSKTLNRAA